MGYTISNDEMARRSRVASLSAAITDTIAYHAPNRMTPLDIIEALTMQLQRYTQMALRDEADAK